MKICPRDNEHLQSQYVYKLSKHHTTYKPRICRRVLCKYTVMRTFLPDRCNWLAVLACLVTVSAEPRCCPLVPRANRGGGDEGRRGGADCATRGEEGAGERKMKVCRQRRTGRTSVTMVGWGVMCVDGGQSTREYKGEEIASGVYTWQPSTETSRGCPRRPGRSGSVTSSHPPESKTHWQSTRLKEPEGCCVPLPVAQTMRSIFYKQESVSV